VVGKKRHKEMKRNIPANFVGPKLRQTNLKTLLRFWFLARSNFDLL